MQKWPSPSQNSIGQCQLERDGQGHMRESPERSTVLETIYNTECQEELQLESIQMFLGFRRIPEFSAYFHHTRGGFRFWPDLYSLPYSLSFSQNHISKSLAGARVGLLPSLSQETQMLPQSHRWGRTSSGHWTRHRDVAVNTGIPLMLWWPPVGSQDHWKDPLRGWQEALDPGLAHGTCMIKVLSSCCYYKVMKIVQVRSIPVKNRGPCLIQTNVQKLWKKGYI